MNIEAYQKITSDIAKLESGIVTLKTQREELLKTSFEANGKSHVYLMDGVEMVIQLTKTHTHFLTIKDKWSKTPRAPKEPKAPKVKAVKAAKAVKVKATKVKTSKEEAKAAFQAALAASKATAITPVVAPVKVVEATATVTATAAVSPLDIVIPLAELALPPDELAKRPLYEAALAQPPVEIDPLEAALADLSK